MHEAPGVVVITGAVGGLGRVVVPQFLEAGYQVCAVDQEPSTLPESASHVPVVADLRSEAQTETAIGTALARFGRVDALVHLIGVFRAGSRLEDTSDELWSDVMDGNLRTAVNAMRAVIPHMRARSSGRIIATGATTALAPVATWAPFCASVAALCETVRVAAAELRSDGITVNAVLSQHDRNLGGCRRLG